MANKLSYLKYCKKFRDYKTRSCFLFKKSCYINMKHVHANLRFFRIAYEKNDQLEMTLQFSCQSLSICQT